MLAAILLPAGVCAMIVLVTAVACIVCKRKMKREEVMEVDDNPVYQEYELDENYERKYSINEVVDNKLIKRHLCLTMFPFVLSLHT